MDRRPRVVVGEAGLEPAISCSQSTCVTRLRYSPPDFVLRGHTCSWIRPRQLAYGLSSHSLATIRPLHRPKPVAFTARGQRQSYGHIGPADPARVVASPCSPPSPCVPPRPRLGLLVVAIAATAQTPKHGSTTTVAEYPWHQLLPMRAHDLFRVWPHERVRQQVLCRMRPRPRCRVPSLRRCPFYRSQVLRSVRDGSASSRPRVRDRRPSPRCNPRRRTAPRLGHVRRSGGLHGVRRGSRR